MSLIEVMVALLVLSLGLLALAGLLSLSLRQSNAALMQQQVVLLAEALIDRMRLNVDAARGGGYDGRYGADAPQDEHDAARCTDAAGCDPDSLARMDRAAWQNALRVLVPAARAEVACAADVVARCDLTITLSATAAGLGTSADVVLRWRTAL